jgi:inositol monophosphatase family protein
MSTSAGLEWLRPVLDRCRALIADHNSPRRWTKSQQGRSELVTEIDLAVERLLIDAIRERVPDAAILSEESNPDPSALEQDTCFVIDPIDGTEELAAGQAGFGISIALFERGRPATAMLDMPAHDWRFESAAGAGASLERQGHPTLAGRRASAGASSRERHPIRDGLTASVLGWRRRWRPDRHAGVHAQVCRRPGGRMRRRALPADTAAPHCDLGLRGRGATPLGGGRLVRHHGRDQSARGAAVRVLGRLGSRTAEPPRPACCRRSAFSRWTILASAAITPPDRGGVREVLGTAT